MSWIPALRRLAVLSSVLAALCFTSLSQAATVFITGANSGIGRFIDDEGHGEIRELRRAAAAVVIEMTSSAEMVA